jgi:hypothetical protein
MLGDFEAAERRIGKVVKAESLTAEARQTADEEAGLLLELLAVQVSVFADQVEVEH